MVTFEKAKDLAEFYGYTAFRLALQRGDEVDEARAAGRRAYWRVLDKFRALAMKKKTSNS